MKNALILHGTNNNHTDNWFPWLAQEFRARGYVVWVPDLPQADRPNIDRYNAFIFDQWQFDDDLIVVGHSSGAVAILGVLQALPKDVVVKKAVMVAGFTDDLDWKPLRNLFVTPFDWNLIKQHAKHIVLFHSDDDPYVPLAHGKRLRDALGAELIVTNGQGHFNLEKGSQYKRFPKLLEKILD